MISAADQFEKILSEAKDDPNIIGFFLGGSRGKGFDNAQSDYDPRMIVRDEAAVEYASKFEKVELKDIDLVVTSLSDFRAYAAWGGHEAWDRYDFSHLRVLVDKTGEIQRLVDEKGAIPNDKLGDFIRYSLDGYINGAYRSIKAETKGLRIGSRLEAAASIPFLLDVIFAIHGRLKPFYGYLERELAAYPLEKLPWSTKDFLERLVSVLATGDITAQQGLLRGVETLARSEGYGQVFDDWEGKDRWAMEWKPAEPQEAWEK